MCHESRWKNELGRNQDRHFMLIPKRHVRIMEYTDSVRKFL